MHQILENYFTGLWPLVWHFGVAGLVILVSLAYFFLAPAALVTLAPTLHKASLWVAVGGTVILISYAVGVGNEHSRCVAQNNAAIESSLAASNAARDEAEKYVASHPIVPEQTVQSPSQPAVGVKPSRAVKWVRAPKSRYNRDTK